MNRSQLEMKVAAKIELKRRRALAFSVYGIYGHKGGVIGAGPELLRCWQWQEGKWVKTDAAPTVRIPEKVERALLTPKAIKMLKGGRGLAKSDAI